ncbi:MAG: class I SAM-dependent methyltransferase, partial [Planctomycetota bacterium]
TELAFAGDVSSAERSIELPRQMLEDIAGGVTPKLRDLIASFEEAADGIPRGESPIHRQFAQRELHPLTLISPWMHRCYTKPFGYAGDYVMLNMVLDDPFQGPNTYAKVLNNSLVTTNPPIAYANRITMLVERLRAENQRVRQDFGRPLRAITVGCGPVNEVQRFLRDDALSRGCNFDLMDFNDPTIRFAQSRVEAVTAETGRDLQVQFVNKSIHELLQEARGKRESTSRRYDLVYCAGLFDYLSDRICGALIELFFSWLNPGGLVVVTNVANSDPIVNVVEYLMEWYLIYRDQDHMLRLAPHLGSQSVAVDATGINMFLDVRKDAEQTDG